jgi:signal transduction histidine kinase/CHASE2 domain-containing sensor protein
MNWRFAEVGWRILPGTIATVLLAGLLKLGALQPLEQAAYQGLFKLRGERSWDNRLVLVKIDDPSLKQLGRFPWSRQRYIELLNRLTQTKANLVVMDILLSEASPDDSELAKVMERSVPVVLAQGEDYTGLPLLPVPSLRDHALATGHIREIADADGIVRKIEAEVRGDPALGIAAIKGYSLTREAIPVPGLTQSIWLNWAGPIERLQQVSFTDVILEKVDPTIFEGKIVIVGATATATDSALTPFNHNPPASGVHLQTTLIHNLLQQNPLRPVQQPEFIVLLFIVGGIGLSSFLSLWRTSFQIAIAAILIMAWIGLSLACLNAAYLLPLVLPISLLSTVTIVTALTERWRMNLILQQQIRQLWQRYQPDLVVQDPLRPYQSFAPFASMQHVTQLTALADQFGRSQSTQAAIARSLSIGLVAADVEGRVWFSNPIATALLKVEIGSRLHDSLVPDWFIEQEWQQALVNLKQQQSIVSRERSIRESTIAEEPRWFWVQLEPFDYQVNDVKSEGVLLLLEDVTTRKTIEANLDQQIHELRRMSQLKDDFLSTVSHELRTPLTNMKMAIQLLQITSNEKQWKHYLGILESECARETELINELLDLQRLDSDKQTIQAELIDFYTWLPEIVEPFYQRAKSRQQYITVKVDPELPCFKSDRASVERLIVELMNNACKYTPPEHKIEITADWCEPYIELSVSNSGVEIPEKERSKIFDRFYRIPRTDPWKQGGTGLGLALVKKLVESLNGSIEVNSQDGWTTFTVSLPLDLDRSLRLR